MNIGFDGWILLNKNWHGSARYLRSLLSATLALDGQNTYHSVYRMFQDSARRFYDDHFDPSEIPPGLRTKRIYLPQSLLERYWDWFEQPFPLSRLIWGDLDIYLTNNYSTVPVFRTTKVVYL